MLGAFIFAAAAICLAWSTGSLYASLGPSLATKLVGIDDRTKAGLFAAGWQLMAGVSQFACKRQPLDRLLLVGPSTLIIGLGGIVLTIKSYDTLEVTGFCRITRDNKLPH